MAELNKILHVEDEPDIQAIAKLTLERVGGYTVESCNSGAEALKAISAFGPDLIVLDVMMPGLDGPATLAEIRKIPDFKGTPAIFMTAKAQSHEIEEFLQLGAIAVITKPFDTATLSDEIRDIWARVTQESETSSPS